MSVRTAARSEALVRGPSSERANLATKAAMLHQHPISFAVIRTPDELAQIASDWDSLHARSADRNPFLSRAWTLACLRIQPGPPELFVAVARSGDQLVGLAPLCIEGRARFRVLRFIADDRSDYLGFLTAAGGEGVAGALLDHLATPSAEWDLLVLRQLTSEWSSLPSELPAGTLRWHRTRWTRAPYLRWDGDWESLHRSGPSWFREMRKRSRRFLRDGHRVERLVGPDAAARLPAVSKIEAASWKGRENSCRLQEGPGRNLLQSAFQTLGTNGQMELWLAFVEEQPVAFQIDFLPNGRVWHYQCAYDERARHTRAGSVLAYAALEHGWSEGRREFDYLSGEEPYKSERTNAARDIYHAAAHARTLRGWAAYAALLAPRWRLRQVPALRTAYEAARAAATRVRARRR